MDRPLRSRASARRPREGHRRRRGVSQAIESYQAALRIDPDNTFAHTNLGAALGERGPEAYYLLGVARMGQGRRQDAVQALQQALALRPGWPVAEAKLAEATGAGTAP